MSERRRRPPRIVRPVDHPDLTVRVICPRCRQATRLPITEAAFRAVPTCCGTAMLFAGQIAEPAGAA